MRTDISVLNRNNDQRSNLPLVMVTWDGVSEPLQHVVKDQTPRFQILIFDYSGAAQLPADFKIRGATPQFYSAKTECKGQIFQHAVGIASKRDPNSYIGLIDDDIVFSFADFNRLLDLAVENDLDVFSATLAHESIYSFKFMLTQTGGSIRSLPWVEVMMPFYRNSIIATGAIFFEQSISSWGIDKYAIPLLQRINNLPKTALVDLVVATHIRPITSRHRVYSNGLTAEQESGRVGEFCLNWIKQHRSSWLNEPNFSRQFQPDRRWSVRYKRVRAKLKNLFIK
jgi:hypothetical protein